MKIVFSILVFFITASCSMNSGLVDYNSDECWSADEFCFYRGGCGWLGTPKHYRANCPTRWAMISEDPMHECKWERKYYRQSGRSCESQEEIKTASISSKKTDCMSMGFKEGTDSIAQCILKLTEIEMVQVNLSKLTSEIERERNRQKLLGISRALSNLGASVTYQDQNRSPVKKPSTKYSTQYCSVQGNALLCQGTEF